MRSLISPMFMSRILSPMESIFSPVLFNSLRISVVDSRLWLERDSSRLKPLSWCISSLFWIEIWSSRLSICSPSLTRIVVILTLKSLLFVSKTMNLITGVYYVTWFLTVCAKWSFPKGFRGMSLASYQNCCLFLLS